MWPSPVEYTGAVAGSMRNSKWMRNGKPRCRDKIDMDPQKVSFLVFASQTLAGTQTGHIPSMYIHIN